MRWSWKIGEIAGIGVYIHATFWLLILFILYASWVEDHNLGRALMGVVLIMLIFACVVLHEFGHALTARRFGIQTRDITLLPIGGLARLERMPEDPRQELWVALAGPAVNVLIAGVLLSVLLAAGIRPKLTDFSLSGGHFLNNLMAINVWLVGFNLLPAFPMDGGRVLRAILATRMEYTQATQTAAHIGQAMAFAFGLVGLFVDPFLVFIALFVWLGAEQEASMVQVRTSVGGIPVQRVMLRDFRTIGPDEPLSRAVESMLAGGQHDFPVVFGDHVLGILTRKDLVKAIKNGGTNVPTREAMQREIQTADSHDMLDHALQLLLAGKGRSLPVVHGGRLVGMLTLDNVGEFMMIQSAIRKGEGSAAARSHTPTKGTTTDGPRNGYYY